MKTSDKVSSNGLGDKVEAVTKKLGIESCSGCKRRKSMLNEISRRGFVGGSLLALFLAKNTILKAAYQVTNTPIPLTLNDMEGFIGQFNVAAVTSFLNSGGDWNAHTGTYPTVEEILAKIEAHRETATYIRWFPAFKYTDKIHPFDGWTLDYDASREGHFVVILSNPQYALISDEIGIHYHATASPTPIAAKSLKSASQYPGAVASGTGKNGKKSLTAWERIAGFFVPTVYATTTCCTSGDCWNQSNNCECGICVSCCCQNGQGCSATPPECTTAKLCLGNPGCAASNCAWVAYACDSNICNCCLRGWGHQCMAYCSCVCPNNGCPTASGCEPQTC
jgi:hypothetical protein